MKFKLKGIFTKKKIFIIFLAFLIVVTTIYVVITLFFSDSDFLKTIKYVNEGEQVVIKKGEVVKIRDTGISLKIDIREGGYGSWSPPPGPFVVLRGRIGNERYTDLYFPPHTLGLYWIHTVDTDNASYIEVVVQDIGLLPEPIPEFIIEKSHK